jgi:hypothetical protein
MGRGKGEFKTTSNDGMEEVQGEGQGQGDRQGNRRGIFEELAIGTVLDGVQVLEKFRHWRQGLRRSGWELSGDKLRVLFAICLASLFEELWLSFFRGLWLFFFRDFWDLWEGAAFGLGKFGAGL